MPPLDNPGCGEPFSSTALVATVLAICLLTIMGIATLSVWITHPSDLQEQERALLLRPT